MTRAAVLTLIAVLASFGAGAQDESLQLLPLPDYPLDEMEDVVRELFEERYAAIEEAAAGEPLDRARLAEAYSALGQIDLSYGRRHEAEICLRNAAVLAPGDSRWTYLLGALYQDEQRTDEAAGYLEQTLKLDAGYPPALLRLGETELLRNAPADAEPHFTAALAAGEGFEAAARYGLGRAAAMRGDPAAAVDHFQAALAAQPAGTAVHHSLGLAYRELGDLDKARHHLRQAGQHKPRFRDPLLQGLVAQGAVANMQRGLTAARRGNYELAAELHRKAVEADPENPTVRQELAEALFNLRDYDGAIAEYRELLRLVPKSPLAHYGLAYALAKRDGASEEAASLARSALALAPDYADAYVLLGRQHERRNESDAAFAAYERALAAAAEHLEARQARARILASRGDTATAVAELERVLLADPTYLDGVLDLVGILARAGGSERAVERLEKTLALDLEPAARVLLTFNLANLFQQQGAVESALEYFRETLELDSEFKDAHFNQAALLLRTGRAADAAAAFQRAVELDPDDAGAYLGWARAAAAAGRAAEARAGLEEALARQGGNAALLNMLARLLATSSEASVRDGARALELARAALAAEPKPEYAETVAMALAELGRFNEAVEWQRGILEQARRAGSSAALLERLGAELELYQQKKPYRAE